MRLALAVVALVVVACSSAPPRGGGGDPPPIDAAVGQAPDAAPPLSAAEQALAQHGERLRDAKGVISVEVSASGEAIDVAVCALEATVGLDVESVGVPVEFVIGTASRVTARGEGCGCSSGYDGKYYAPGESFSDGCNQCTCAGENNARCTLLDCSIRIYEKVYFAKNATKLSGNAQQVLDAVAQVLANHPALRMRIIGHAARGEKKAKALALARAQAVVAALVAAGVAADRLDTEERGDAEPFHSKDKAQNRRVEFDVIQPD